MEVKRKEKEVRFQGVRRGFSSLREEGEGLNFHVEGLKTENVREPNVESLVRGIWVLRVSLRSRAGSTGRCGKLKTCIQPQNETN